MTSTASEAASYEFTTLTCIPGVIEVSWGVLDSRRERARARVCGGVDGCRVCGCRVEGEGSELSCFAFKHWHL